MFKIGDLVTVVKPGAEGTSGEVTYADDSVVYFETKAGVEHEFKPSHLVMASEYETPFEKEQRLRYEQKSKENELSDAVCAEIISKIPEGIPAIAHYNFQLITTRFAMFGTPQKSWEELSPTVKMNHICVATGVSLPTWIQALADGNLTRCVWVAFSNIGAAIRANEEA